MPKSSTWEKIPRGSRKEREGTQQLRHRPHLGKSGRHSSSFRRLRETIRHPDLRGTIRAAGPRSFASTRSVTTPGRYRVLLHAVRGRGQGTGVTEPLQPVNFDLIPAELKTRTETGSASTRHCVFRHQQEPVKETPKGWQDLLFAQIQQVWFLSRSHRRDRVRHCHRHHLCPRRRPRPHWTRNRLPRRPSRNRERSR